MSEKIRVRQKKLLQQLQRQLQEQPIADENAIKKALRDGPSRITSSRQDTTVRKARVLSPPQTKTPRQRFAEDIPIQARADYDILDSLVSSVGERPNEDRSHAFQEQSPSEPTDARTRSRARANQSGEVRDAENAPRSGFDTLLQSQRPFQSWYPSHPPKQIATRSRRAENRQQGHGTQRPQSMRSATSRDTSTAAPRPKKSLVNRPKNSFLAPTQASLNRMHQLSFRDGGNQQRPFIP